MSKLLLIDTATSVCSVSISVNKETIFLKEENSANIHASKLTLFIEEVCNQASIKLKDIDAVAISKGPGSYTGLRIGVSTAKGLCFALDKPLVAINTLKMMASGFLTKNPSYKGLICPMIDARRMEVFTAMYDQDLNEIMPTQAKIIDELSFNDYLIQNTITFIGNGAEKCMQSITQQNAKFCLENYNSAKFMYPLAENSFLNKEFEDVAYFEPFYLKDFVFTIPKKKS